MNTRVASAAMLAVVFLPVLAAPPHQDKASQLLVSARTKSITPKATPPANVDWNRVQDAFQFMGKHGQTIQTTNIAVSLVSTFACKDVEPVLIWTQEVVDNYDNRMDKTGQWISEMLHTPKDKQEFLKKNYSKAYDLGVFHRRVASRITPKDLGWNSHQRTVLNQQAVAFVLYALAWQPIETMEATHEIDAAKDAKAVDDWLYLWRIYGHAMGLEDALLPTNAKASRALVMRLRTAQYPSVGEHPMKDVPLLLRNEMAYMYKVLLQGQPATDDAKHKIRMVLAQSIDTSPGLSQALGLGKDPAPALEKIAAG